MLIIFLGCVSVAEWVYSGFDFVLVTLTLLLQKILVGFIPTKIFAPTSKVSGLSVLSLNVKQGTLRTHISSCIPTESVKTNEKNL
jgi:hypothetical protein